MRGGVDGIAQEVDQDLAKLGRVPQYRRKRLGLHLDAHRSSIGFILETRGDAIDEFQHVNGRSLRLIADKEFAQPRQHVSRTLQFPLSLFHGFGEALMVEAIAIK